MSEEVYPGRGNGNCALKSSSEEKYVDNSKKKNPKKKPTIHYDLTLRPEQKLYMYTYIYDTHHTLHTHIYT